jgi:hypothetical protein
MSVTGSVYFFEDFQFSDGEQGDKLFVVLCDPADKIYPNFLVALTTSQEKAGRTKTQGCGMPSNPSYFYPVTVESFHKDTWVVFGEIYEITGLELMTKTIDKKASHKFSMKPENFRALLNCITKSEDISNECMAAIRQIQKNQKDSAKASSK